MRVNTDCGLSGIAAVRRLGTDLHQLDDAAVKVGDKDDAAWPCVLTAKLSGSAVLAWDAGMALSLFV